MNNFVFSQDPLLYTAITGRQQNQPDYELKRQLDDALAQYQAISQQAPPPQTPKNDTKDYLGEIDMLVGNLDEDVAIQLNSDVEFLKLNEDLQRMIQEEMLKSVKWKINTNPEAINKMDRLKELINAAQKNKSDEDRKIMADINDYIKNYSDLTFDEYKQLKKSK